MGTELKTDSWHRYMLYRSDGSYLPFASREERQKSVDEGRKFTLAAYPDVWAKDAGLVQRVRQFLADSFHWHGRLAKSGSDIEVVQTLHEMVRGGSVVVIPEAPQRGGGSDGMLRPSRPPVRYLNEADAADLRAWVKSIQYPPGEPVLSGPYDPSTRESLLAAAQAAMPTGDDSGTGDDDDNAPSVADATPDTSTPLGDAQPFELGDDAVSGDVQELAATDRGSMYACNVIASECKGSVLREFPGQYLNSTLDDIQSDASDGVKDARKALKLLNDNRFKK